ncbi:MAG: 2-oxoacid:acceptor oxidoreductase family protein [Bacilli bacterium]|jgi:2-oxoglutarate ferredoxin oxidoreductase subunit gamma|nr:2-oxoacid:acceptor oxidoreductase family protein [Bacilli bacterium]
METKMIFAGFGGQGVLLAGQLIAEAGMQKGKNVSWMPSYGPEMRGGTANCSVVISDDIIGTPIILDPQILVAMNKPSLESMQNMVVENGTIIYNSSLIKKDEINKINGINYIGLPCSEIALELGNPKVQNMPIIGAVMEVTKSFNEDDIKKAMLSKFGETKAKMIDLNMEAVAKGKETVIKGVN